MNTSGYKGVSWSEERKKWVAAININGRRTSLGRFDEITDAYAAYCMAAKMHHGEFARTA